MLKVSNTKTKSLRVFSVGIFILLSLSGKASAQEIVANVVVDERVAASFCNDLREAVRVQDRKKISSWIHNYPIEIQRNNKNILVEDNADFVLKYDQIFDTAIRSSLFGPSGCESKPRPEGDAGLAGGQIIITQIKKEAQPFISEISPPADTRDIPSDQYEKGASDFYTRLQKAISADDKTEVASMCRYPISVSVEGKRATIVSRAQLIRNYPKIFTPEVKKAVLTLPSPIHMGWRGFMTASGELWLDWVVGTHVYRVVAINGG
jgi:hypothetical protein